MRKFGWFAALFGLLVLSACVTINVYFPAAEAQEAAREFVEKVIGDELPSKSEAPMSETPGSGGMAALLSFFISDARAQTPDLVVKTPAILAIQARMGDRFQSQLAPHFDSGALGFDNNGLIVVRDPSKLSLKDRAAVNQSVADDNRDRAAVYREIAVANGHAEWEQRIRETFARQWVTSARSGWWYEDAAGTWMQK